MKKIIKILMKLFPVLPKTSQFGNNEIFRHKNFINADNDTKKEIMINSAQWRYDYEQEYLFSKKIFNKLNLSDLLKDKTVLDLGCFTGGESIAWAKHYNTKMMYGIDTEKIFIESAVLFSQKMGANAQFKLGCGEKIPFEDDFFDAIINLDVFEHVRDLRATLKECSRVLKHGGMLICVFPQYLSPFEHHLTLVTKTPYLQCFFSPKNLMEAYNEIIDERGPDAYWYKRSQTELENWEKLNTINGTSIADFRKMINKSEWHIFHYDLLPILTTGRFFKRHLIFRLLSKCFYILTKIPRLNELFTDRIVCVLQKK